MQLYESIVLQIKYISLLQFNSMSLYKINRWFFKPSEASATWVMLLLMTWHLWTVPLQYRPIFLAKTMSSSVPTVIVSLRTTCVTLLITVEMAQMRIITYAVRNISSLII